MSAESVVAALRAVPTSAARAIGCDPSCCSGVLRVVDQARSRFPTSRRPGTRRRRLGSFSTSESRPGSQAVPQTIRSRVTGNHLDGNAGSSTFRLSMASLLFERDGWRPQQRAKKVVLKGEDNARAELLDTGAPRAHMDGTDRSVARTAGGPSDQPASSADQRRPQQDAPVLRGDARRPQTIQSSCHLVGSATRQP